MCGRSHPCPTGSHDTTRPLNQRSSAVAATLPAGQATPSRPVHCCLISGASMPSRRMRLPWISIVSPSMTSAVPVKVALRTPGPAYGASRPPSGPLARVLTSRVVLASSVLASSVLRLVRKYVQEQCRKPGTKKCCELLHPLHSTHLLKTDLHSEMIRMAKIG